MSVSVSNVSSTTNWLVPSRCTTWKTMPTRLTIPSARASQRAEWDQHSSHFSSGWQLPEWSSMTPFIASIRSIQIFPSQSPWRVTLLRRKKNISNNKLHCEEQFLMTSWNKNVDQQSTQSLTFWHSKYRQAPSKRVPFIYSCKRKNPAVTTVVTLTAATTCEAGEVSVSNWHSPLTKWALGTQTQAPPTQCVFVCELQSTPVQLSPADVKLWPVVCGCAVEPEDNDVAGEVTEAEEEVDEGKVADDEVEAGELVEELEEDVDEVVGFGGTGLNVSESESFVDSCWQVVKAQTYRSNWTNESTNFWTSCVAWSNWTSDCQCIGIPTLQIGQSRYWASDESLYTGLQLSVYKCKVPLQTEEWWNLDSAACSTIWSCRWASVIGLLDSVGQKSRMQTPL